MRTWIAAALVLAACNSDSSATDAAPAIDGAPIIDARLIDGPPPPTSCDPAMRQTLDRLDDSADPQVHVIYALPSDGTDRHLDTDGTLAGSVAAWAKWLRTQTGGPGLRLDTCSDSLDITAFTMTKTDAAILAMGAFVRDEIEAELDAAGMLADNKLYAVYYDGESNWACGGGAWPPTLQGRVAAMYLHGLENGPVPCDTNPWAPDEDTPGYLEFAMLHEIIHTLGLVAACAPHQTLSGHTSDSSSDLMYAGDQPWYPSVLDIGHDDYYAHGANCGDLARSALMDPTPAGAVLPPGW